MLSLYKLEIFAAVVLAGSFSAAAQNLYMTQPAVSQHIQDLEHSLGTSLFIRGRRGVTLTTSGETLHDYTKRILSLVAEAESQVTNVEHLSSGQLTLGATSGVSTYLLPDWLQGFREKYPQLNIALQTAVTSKTIAGVMEHQLDIAFVEGELEKLQRKGLGHMVLRPVVMVVTVGQGHDWCKRDNVTIDMLHEHPFITRQAHSRTRIWIDSILEEHAIQPRIVGEFDNQEAIKQAVMANMGVAILPDYTLERELSAGLIRTLSVEGVLLQRQLKLIYDERMSFTPIARALLLYLTDIFPSLQALVQT
jgi:LysR family transcriptional regulator, low CO2-responsive transcriptional regulator